VLQRHKIAGTPSDFSHRQEADRAQRHEKQFDEQEGGEQFGSNRRRNATDISSQRVLSSHRRPHGVADRAMPRNYIITQRIAGLSRA
jgi:hypothetical protein